MNQQLHNHSDYFKIDFVRDVVSKNCDFETVSSIFSILADSTRLKIFWLLCHSKECGQNMAQLLNISMPAVSHHLKQLRDEGLIEGYRDGKEVFYCAASTDKVILLHEVIEKFMSMSCPDFTTEHERINENSEFMKHQVNTIKKVHDFLTSNLEKRITIEELSKNFAMNPTTLKTVFKDVYGTSIAAHIKEHRMEKAAELLAKTELNINEVAGKVGYESQSKFSAAFKEHFGKTPAEYKKSKLSVN